MKHSIGNRIITDVVAKGFRARKGQNTQDVNDKVIGDKATFKTFQGVKK